MIYRDGSTSTFPLSLDNFQTNVSIGASGVVVPESLERSAIVNHFFDAALNIEKLLLSSANIPLIGVLPDASGTVSTADYARHIYFAQTKVHLSLTGYTSGGLITACTAPTAFGTDPFNDPSFLVIINPTLTGFDDSYNPIGNRGNYLSQGSTVSQGFYNQLLQIPFIYTGVVPAAATGGTGRMFNIYTNVLSDHFLQTYIFANFFEYWTSLPYVDPSVWSATYGGWAATYQALQPHVGYYGSSYVPQTDKNTLGINLPDAFGVQVSQGASLYYTPPLPINHEIEFQVDWINPMSTDNFDPHPVVLINVGGTTTSSGWVGDKWGPGSGHYSTADSIDISAVTNPAPMDVYQSYSGYGDADSVWTMQDLNPYERYRVRLHFAEIYYNDAGRAFDILIGDASPALIYAGFDPFVVAGNTKDKATVVEAIITANADGKIYIKTHPLSSRGSIINGIEVDTIYETTMWAGPAVRLSQATSYHDPRVVNGVVMHLGSVPASGTATHNNSSEYYTLVALYNDPLYVEFFPETNGWTLGATGSTDPTAVCDVKLTTPIPLRTIAKDGPTYKYRLAVVGNVVTVYISSDSGATWSTDTSVDLSHYSLPTGMLTALSGGTVGFVNKCTNFYRKSTANILPVRISASPNTPPPTSLGIDLDIMFMKIGDSSSYKKVTEWPRTGWSL